VRLLPIGQLSLLFIGVQVTSAMFILSGLLVTILAALDGFAGSEGALILFGVYTPYLCYGTLLLNILAQMPWREHGKPIWRNGQK